MSDTTRMPDRTSRWGSTTDWWTLMLLGVLTVLAGAFAIIYPLAAGVATTGVFGIVIIIAAIAHLVHTIAARKGAWSTIAGLIVSVLLAAAGLFLLAHPLFALYWLTVFLGVLYVVMGLFGLAQSLDAAGLPGSGFWLIGSLATLILGIWALAELPRTYYWFLGIIVGVDLISFGVQLLVLSAATRGRRAGGMTLASQP